MIVAIQGQAGSFHDQVAKQWYGQSVDTLPCATFAEVFEVYADGQADAIITAVENTIYGSINQVYQFIEDCEAPIIGEVKLKVEQMLIALPNTSLADITEVYSHPIALAQCKAWLSENLPNAELIEYFDTAGAVEYIKESGNKNMSAIASRNASEIYNLPIIAESIQDSSDNITRFLVLEPTDNAPDASKSSIVVTTSHKPGALVEVLQFFATAGVNLAKLQSQPIIGEPWNYKFFIDIDCAGDKLYQLADKIEALDHSITLLGEYKAD